MKKFYLLVIITTITITAFSQTYRPMLKENKTWDVYHDFYQQGIEGYDRFFLEGDTLVGGALYHKVQIRPSTANPLQLRPPNYFYNNNYSFSGKILREDSVARKIWVRDLFNPSDTTELLIYDFSVSVGDTMLSNQEGVVWGVPPYTRAVVDSIALFTLNNNDVARIFYVTAIDFGTFSIPSYPFFVIEGVGGQNGFLTPFEGVFEHDAKLSCVNENRVNLFSGFIGTCYFTVGINEGLKVNDSFELSPNPNNGKNIFISGKDLNLVKFYNIYGQLIKSVLVNNNETTININNQPKGTYFVKAQFKNGETFTKKMVIK